MAETKKLSISLPADIVERVREFADRRASGNISAVVLGAVTAELRRYEALDAVGDWEAEHGVLTPEEVAAARGRWRA